MEWRRYNVWRKDREERNGGGVIKEKYKSKDICLSGTITKILAVKNKG